MILVIIGLCCGMALLWYAGEKIINYSIEVAQLFDISPIFISSFILSLATGLPELLVALQAIMVGAPGLSVGDILGSNFIDATIVIGIPILIFRPIVVDLPERSKKMVLLATSALVTAVIFFTYPLGKVHGVVLIAVYIVAMSWFWKNRSYGNHLGQTSDIAMMIDLYGTRGAQLRSSMKLAGCLLLIVIGSRIAIAFALQLAEITGMAHPHVGALILSLGTDLPELTVAINAVRKKQYALALGSALGSILEQGSLILGILLLGSSTTISLDSIWLLGPFTFVALALIACGLMYKKITRFHGALLVALYFGYIFAQLLTL